MPDAFYEPAGDGVYAPTEATTSPWDERAQHGGPPAALIGHVVGVQHPREDAIVGRLAVDFLGPIPRRPLRARSAVLRPGSRVELFEVTLEGADGGKVCVAARVWRIRTTPLAHAIPLREEPPPPLPVEQPQRFFEGIPETWGYGRAIEWRFVHGALDEYGPSAVWARLRVPLVAGTPLDPLSRLLVVADSANGLSLELPLTQWLSIPPALSVTIGRYPEGEWVFFSTRTHAGPLGTGFAEAHAADTKGTLAAIAQPLLIEPRP